MKSPEDHGGVLPVSVVIPTAGRARPLERVLASIAACRPAPAEVLVVDQSGDAAVDEVVRRYAPARARLVPCNGRGVSSGRNVGLRQASHELVLVTDDDCTVEPDWVGKAWRLAAGDTDTIITGRVLPVGDARAVPSTIDDPERRDYTGERRGGLLFPNNMALNRSAVLALDGGFDERFGPEEAAEDNEFCYRWLKAGKRLVYEPSLVVHHHDWRTPAELESLYRRYARGEGFFYAKHLRSGDLRMLRFIARDLVWSVRGLLAAVLKRRERWTDFRRATLAGLPGGFRDGWRTYGGRHR
jgi:glycosyltransferase involved in cell wall biosynthesis